MEQPILRTGVTSLSDAELLILDIAALNGGLRSFFSRDVFPRQYNYPSHHLPDELLHETLDRFEQEGIIDGENHVNYASQPDRTIRITKRGGAIWESERKPDWSRYVMDWYPGQYIAIYGHSAAVCEFLFEVAQSSQFIEYSGGPVRRAVAERQLIYWRKAQPVHCLAARISKGQSWLICNWDEFHANRCWWRFPDEISRFWDWPTAVC